VIEKLRKSGTWLDADSPSVDFAKEVFVVHPMDEDLIKRISRLAGRGSFVLFIRSIPGTGKSHLFRALENGEPAKLFEQEPFRTVRRRFSFVNINSAGSDFAKLPSNTIVTVPDAARYADKLEELRARIAKGIKNVRGVLIAGNTGMLTLNDFLKNLKDSLRRMNIAVEEASRDVWIKEYGMSSNERALFGKFTLALLAYLKDTIERAKCQACTSDGTEYSVSQLREMFEDAHTRDRIHDLLLAVRLNRSDVYLTPRTLCIFIADTVMRLVHKRLSDEEIFQSMYYESAVVSSSYPREYRLTETNIHSSRIWEIERETDVPQDHLNRRMMKLRYYLDEQSKRQIYDGLYADFLDDRLADSITNNAFILLSTTGEKALGNVTYDFRTKASQRTSPVTWGECMFAFPYRGANLITNRYIDVDLLVNENHPLRVGGLQWAEKIRQTSIAVRTSNIPRSAHLPRLDLDLATFRLLKSVADGFDLDVSSETPETIRLLFFLYQIRECVPVILAGAVSSSRGAFARERVMIIGEKEGRVENLAAEV
jgi:hypothetical protein